MYEKYILSGIDRSAERNLQEAKRIEDIVENVRSFINRTKTRIELTLRGEEPNHYVDVTTTKHEAKGAKRFADEEPNHYVDVTTMKHEAKYAPYDAKSAKRIADEAAEEVAERAMNRREGPTQMDQIMYMLFKRMVFE